MFELLIGAFIFFVVLKVLFSLGFGLLRVGLSMVGFILLFLLLPIGLGLLLPIFIVGGVFYLLFALLGAIF
jgi:hypothetical protein